MRVVGLRWDHYLPAVEGQITRDMIALQSAFGKVTAVYKGSEPDSLMSALGIETGIGEALADLWIVYTTKEGHQVEAPETAKEVIERNMFNEKTDIELNDKPNEGYYLKPQGRIGKPRLSQLPKPSHNGQTNPLIVLLWG